MLLALFYLCLEGELSILTNISCPTPLFYLLLKPFMPNWFSHPYQLDEFQFQIRGVLGCIFQILIEQFNLLANVGDPNQTPDSVASDLGLHCLPMSHKMDTWLILVA